MGALACAGCTACCRDQLVVLVKEDGDPAQWETVPLEVETPEAIIFEIDRALNGGAVDEEIRVLRTKPDGSCVYLAEGGADGGCTIYDRRPAMCRAFDCRRMVRDWLTGNTDLPTDAFAHPVGRAGLERLKTLDD